MSQSKRLTAADIMTEPVVTGRPDEDLTRIASEMHRRNIGSIVIAENRKAVGILTERDFVRIVEQVGTLLHKNLAKHHMAQPVITVQSDTPIAEIAKLMKEKHIRHIVVLNKSKEIAGIVSYRDLTKLTSELAYHD
jgi:CBS domain-containing protein